MKENLNKDVWLDLGRIYLGRVEDLIKEDREEWEKDRWRILCGSEIKIIGANHQYSKLAFTSHIDKLKGIERGK